MADDSQGAITRSWLRKLIRAKRLQTGIPDPHKLAIRLLEDGDIKPRNYLDVLRLTLPHECREVYRGLRKAGARSGAAVRGPGAADDPASDERRPTNWDVWVDGEWIKFGDCTVEQAEALADLYYERANREQRRADFIVACAAAMRETGAEHIRDLKDTLDEIHDDYYADVDEDVSN